MRHTLSLQALRAACQSGLLIVAVVVVVVGLGGCRGSDRLTERAPRPVAADSSVLAAAYASAIQRAATLGPEAVVHTLTPVVPHNDTLRWRTDSDRTRWVQVTTWTDTAPLPGAATARAAGDTLTLRGDVWVTLVPAVQQFCQRIPPEQRTRRLEQRLGLPPYAGYTRFVTFWVRPADLFRPCPDPETTDRQCSTVTPRPASRVRVDTAHVRWLRAQRAFSHQPGGYPFTGLGYTYDWGRPAQPVGFSEFVVPEGARIQVAGRAATAAYCTPDRATDG